MVTRSIVTNAIVDANVADVSTEVENTSTDKRISITYIGKGKMMITSYDPDV